MDVEKFIAEKRREQKRLMDKYKNLIAEIYGKEAAPVNPIISAFRSVELPNFGFGRKK